MADKDELELWQKFRTGSIDELHQALHSESEVERFASARELQVRGDTKTFEYAVLLSKKGNPTLREIAAFILGQLGTPKRPFRELSIPVLDRLVEEDDFATVRAAAAAALGHLCACESLIFLDKAAKNQDADVRINAAFALGNLQCREAIQALLYLTQDGEEEVVSWAVLGLRKLNAVTPAVRSRFIEMLGSTSKDIREDVICGLAKWNDSRATDALLRGLEEQDINLELLEAAGDIGDERVLARLCQLKRQWDTNPPPSLDEAITKIAARCGEI